MERPRILDLFCGAGGAGYGLTQAGFDVTGVDIKPQKRYEQNEHMHFVQDDAVAYALAYGWRFDAIWASPPCQTHSQITPDKSKHLDLIPQTRFVLESLGMPYIIENVYGAKRALRNPVMLCGADFGLKVYRHRLFESNVMLLVPPHVPHYDSMPGAGHAREIVYPDTLESGGRRASEVEIASVIRSMAVQNARNSTFAKISPKGFISVAGNTGSVAYARFAMGIDWMTNAELSQAIPPAYSAFLGRQLMQYVQAKQIER